MKANKNENNLRKLREIFSEYFHILFSTERKYQVRLNFNSAIIIQFHLKCDYFP